MLISTRETKGLGNSALYARLRNASGQFWDFVGLAWVSPQTNDCRTFLTERADASTTESYYAADVTIPAGGPWDCEIVVASTSEVTTGPFQAIVPAIAGDQMALTAAAIDAIIDEVVEGTITLRQCQRALLALISKVSGGGTDTIVYRDSGDTKNRITQTVDASGNRSAVTLDLT